MVSRVGKKPIVLPEGVSIEIDRDRSLCIVKGKHGEVSCKILPNVSCVVESGIAKVSCEEDKKLWGLYRSLISNMVVGVSSKMSKSLRVSGVGYNVSCSAGIVTLSLGYSHKIKVFVPDDLDVEVKDGLLVVSGVDKQKVGSFVQKLEFRKRDPYKQKGIYEEGSFILKKDGKKK